VPQRALTVIALVLATRCSGRATDPLVSIAIGPASLDAVDAGSTIQLTATGTYRDGTIREITSSVAWASSDPAAASSSCRAR
jgi:hypothetical protein